MSYIYIYVYLDGKHSHDYAACDAIPFASTEGEHNLLACFSPTTTLLPINQVIDHAYITLSFPPRLSHAEKSTWKADVFSFSIHPSRLMDVVVFKFAIDLNVLSFYIYIYSNVNVYKREVGVKERRKNLDLVVEKFRVVVASRSSL